MAFCGQCGLLLPPKVATCPRCGVAVVPSVESEGQNAHDPTIISAGLEKTETSRRSYTPRPDQMPEPNQFIGSNDQTQRSAQGGPTFDPSLAQNAPFPNQYAPSSYPPPPPDYISRTDREFPTTQQGGSYPGYIPARTAFEGTPPPANLPQKSRHTSNLVIILLSLLLVAIISVATTLLFVIGPDRIFGITGGGPTPSTPQSTATLPTAQAATPTSGAATPTTGAPTPTSVPSTPTPTPQQQAQAVITHYYTAINNKDYPTAYNLWVNNPDSYQTFADGFATTQHDDYQFGQILRQSDGTVQVNITLVATSTSSQQTTYQGYYMVGQQPDGSWKIVTAHMEAV